MGVLIVILLKQFVYIIVLHTVLGIIFFVLELDLDVVLGALCRVRISCTDNGGESPWLKYIIKTIYKYCMQINNINETNFEIHQFYTWDNF